jgi:sucrose-6-phosphate hydrolase SacC (GH32 family)
MTKKYLALFTITLLFVCFAAHALEATAKVLAYENFSTVKQSTANITLMDFEGGTYGKWVVTGTAFGEAPASGALSGQMEVSGFAGKGLANSFYGGDSSTGTLTSPAFTIDRDYIVFLIGGGGYAGETCMNLIIDGEIVRTATGTNVVPGGSEHLDQTNWNVKAFKGKKARIQIVDKRTAGWGHINVDNIVLTNQSKLEFDYHIDFTITDKYINFPVKTGAAKSWITLEVEGEEVRQFDIELSTNPDFWTYLETEQFIGKNARIIIDRSDAEAINALRSLSQSAYFVGEENLYSETLRPQLHFSAKRGWLNDSNGMVYYNGTYHLFFQHNPYGWNWGNMTWGHAVSSDMVHWQQVEEAIHPDALGTIFSGSAVVDKNNTAGFKDGAEDTIVAFYTAAGGNNLWSAGVPFTQCIAYSTDAGKTFAKYEGNPVIEHIAGDNRDPKVIWHEPSGHWVLALYIDGHDTAIFTSSNLKEWTQSCMLKDSFFECPEIFPLKLDGTGEEKWVMYGATGDYMIGSFDGEVFAPETAMTKFEYGNCFYASQTFSDIPAEDGRRLQIGWGRVTMPGMPFNQMMLFPVSLTLHSTDEGQKVFVNPASEIESLHKLNWHFDNAVAGAGINPLSAVGGRLMHIKGAFSFGDASSVVVNVRGKDITFDKAKGEIRFLDKIAPLPVEGDKVSVELIVDRMSVELYAGGGEVYMPMGVNLTGGPESLSLTANGECLINSMDVWQLESIWF